MTLDLQDDEVDILYATGKNRNRNTSNKKNRVNNSSTTSKPKEKFIQQRTEFSKGIHIQPKNENQQKFLDSMSNNIITIGSGSAGTGKTHISCRYAAKELLAGNIQKIVISRPYVAVSGRTTGFKPDSDLEKLRAFIQPMLNELYAVLGKGMVEQHLAQADKIELAPLESIRGRSFDNTIIILDESSNTTVGEIQAITTRLGLNTKLFLIGDNAQTDTSQNGLRWFEELVKKYDIPDVGVVKFTHDDIVRSDMVKALVIAFEKEGGYKS